MQKLLPLPLTVAFILSISSCVKDSAVENLDTQHQDTSTLSIANSLLIVNGSFDLETYNANVASLGIVNYRSSYELCGTAGSDLDWPVVLPLSDSSIFPPSLLSDEDSLSAEVELDTTLKKDYNITLLLIENKDTLFNLAVSNASTLKKKFLFHNADSYQIFATAK